jgi:AcrR family transcriptional regulator
MRTATLLEAKDWLDAGLELLRTRGIGGVQVGPLCRRVGVTKGSFYHHFTNQEEFLQQLIEHWREITTPSPEQVAEITKLKGLEDSVRTVLDFIREHDLGRYDLAMRTWAQEDVQARQATEFIDKVRVTATARLFEAEGWAREAALRRAKTMYYFIAGRYEIEGRPPTPEEGAEFARMLTRVEAGSC